MVSNYELNKKRLWFYSYTLLKRAGSLVEYNRRPKGMIERSTLQGLKHKVGVISSLFSDSELSHSENTLLSG